MVQELNLFPKSWRSEREIMAVNNNMEGASNPLIGVALRGNKDKKRSGGVSLSLGNMVETRGGRGRGTERKQQH